MTSRKHRKYSRWRLPLAFCATVAASVLLSLWYLGCLTANFRVVTPGKLYRAGQMSEAQIRRTISTYGIKTIVNLAGQSQEAWYPGELKACKDLGVKHINIAMGAHRLPRPEKVAGLVEALKNESYPMLIHCLGGSDRSGLACAIYRTVIEHAPVETAVKEQLTWRYGHFTFGNARAMDQFFELYRQDTGGKDLERWIIEDYPSYYAKWRTMRQ
jgi:protein tyrosine/serine phosphatase